jgi:pimeloyl-ACP methyl ester carboxylesterase
MENEIFRLRNGRGLGYSDRGSPSGTPLILLHGTPGSRLVEAADERSLKALGIRVIVPERPGYGLSDPQKHGSISDFAGDVAELANHLALDRFHVMALSGGSPYALACALNLPSQVISATIVSGATAPEVFQARPDLVSRNRIGFALARFAPFVLKWGSQSFADTLKQTPLIALRQLQGQLNGQPTQENEGPPNAQEAENIKQLHEAFRQGVEGHYRDMRLLYRPWTLPLDKLSVPVHLWHGEKDPQIDLEAAKAMAELLPGCDLNVVPGASHLVMEDPSISMLVLKHALDRSKNSRAEA